MSTLSPTVVSVAPEWVPSPLYRLSLEQYEAMVESGVFTARDRFHLINGFLVAKTTQNPPHSTADELCGTALDQVIPAGWYVRSAKPVRLPDQVSKPEPDRCVVRGTIRDYSDRDPGAADVALIVEASDSSLNDDRKLARIYGGSGIATYWIVNLSTATSRSILSPLRTVTTRARTLLAASFSRLSSTELKSVGSPSPTSCLDGQPRSSRMRRKLSAAADGTNR